MIQLAEMRTTLPMDFDGIPSTTTDVWETLVASERGDLARVKELVARSLVLAACKYNYMPPIHLAVREGHSELVRFLLENGGLVPNYVSYPFRETLLMTAQERGHGEIAQLLEAVARDSSLAAPCPAPGDGGAIEYGADETSVRLQKLISSNKQGLAGKLAGKNTLSEVEAILRERPELALDEFKFWGEGILAMPANHGDREMIELLLRYGARVPDVTKWGAWYYFKHYDTGEFLLDHGMNPAHMTWQRVTLLHDVAWTGDARKARLLIDRGAALDAIDEEYRSTPLGFAARWGKRDVAALLLERGANVGAAAAPWATPLAWARMKGHTEIERDLLRAGAKR